MQHASPLAVLVVHGHQGGHISHHIFFQDSKSIRRKLNACAGRKDRDQKRAQDNRQARVRHRLDAW